MTYEQNVIGRLATSQNTRSEIPNQELAGCIAANDDSEAVQILVGHLFGNDKQIQSDCIKTLYEIGARKPKLIATYYKEFLSLLESKHNRMIWGAMTALDTITPEQPHAIAGSLQRILSAADTGSVITRDHAVGILLKLSALPAYTDEAMPFFFQQLRSCPTNQLPMYAEHALPVITKEYVKEFSDILHQRLNEIEKDSKKKRIIKVLDTLSRQK